MSEKGQYENPLVTVSTYGMAILGVVHEIALAGRLILHADNALIQTPNFVFVGAMLLGTLARFISPIPKDRNGYLTAGLCLGLAVELAIEGAYFPMAILGAISLGLLAATIYAQGRQINS